MIGRFMPFHKGHASVLQALYKENGYPCVVCCVTNTKVGEELAKKGYGAHLWGCGTDREKQYQRMATNKKYLTDFPDDFKLFVVKRDEQSSNVDGISATKVRQAIKDDDKAAFVKMMPDGAQKLFNEFKEELSKVNESKCCHLGEYISNENYFDIE